MLLLVVNHFFSLSSLSPNLTLNTSICLLILCRRPEESIKDLGKNSSSQEQCSICVEAGLPFLSNPLFQTQHNTHFRPTLLQLEDHQGRRNLVHRQTTEVFQELLDHTDGASGGSES